MPNAPNQDASHSLRDEVLIALVPHVMHRLGNLLTVAMGISDLLALDESDSKRAKELDAIGSTARQATKLVHALGLHARSKPGSILATDLQESLTSLDELISSMVKGGGYELELRDPAGITVVLSDPTRLRLLTLCLIITATNPGGELSRRGGHLSLRAVELTSRVVILISLRVPGGVLSPATHIDPRAKNLALELGVHLRTRTHPGGMGQSFLLGFPVI